MKRPREELRGLRKLLHDYFIGHVERGIPVVVAIQKLCRSPLLDRLFLWSGFFGSEAFYVGLIPIVFWVGAPVLAANAMLLLSWSCWFCAFLKDYFSLPRPSSPPVDFMEQKVSREYGCPSSHTSVAVAVPLWSVLHICSFDAPDGNVWWSIYNTRLVVGLCFACLWALSLGFGRLYLGVHSPLDVIFGAVVGFIFFLVHWHFRAVVFGFLDSFPHAFYVSTIVAIVLLWLHPRPMEATSSKKEAITLLSSATGVVYGCTKGVLRTETPHYVGLLLADHSLSTLTITSVAYFVFGLFLRILIGYALMYGTQIIGKKILYAFWESLYAVLFSDSEKQLKEVPTSSKGKPVEENFPQSIARYTLLLTMSAICSHFSFVVFDSLLV